MNPDLEAIKWVLTNKDKMLQAGDKFTDMFITTLNLPNTSSTNGRFIHEVAKNNIRQSINVVFSHAESEIEKIFLNSLIIKAASDNPLFLRFTNPLFSPEQEIENKRKFYKYTSEILQLFRKNQSGSVFDNYFKYIYSRDDTEEEKLNMASEFLDYFVFNMYNRFHVSIKSRFDNIRVNGKSIRPDIFIWLPSVPAFKLIIECDGYAFHSNKEAFTNDRIRDRELQIRGFQVLRFSGHEIVANPLFKSKELYNYLVDIYNQISISFNSHY